MRRCLLFFVLVLTLISCSPVQPSQVPTERAVAFTSTLEPTSTPAPSTPTLTPEELLKAHPEIVAVEQYGMPQEQAQKLEGLNISFERITEHVDGVLVIDQETGAELFYFDYQTEFLVAVDRWNQVTSAEQLSENPVTGEELLSNEWFAWTKYLLSKTEAGVGPDMSILPEVTERGEMLSFAYKKIFFLINYPGLINKGVTYADVTAVVDGEERRYRTVVNGYEFEGQKYPMSLISHYYPDHIEPEKMAEHSKRFESMARSPIITSTIDSHEKEDPFISSIYEESSWVAAMDLLQHGNPSSTSRPGSNVYLTLISEGRFFGN